MSISVVIPVYNSERILPELLQRLHDVLSSLGEEFEVILVNDGSSDGSERVITEFASRHPWIQGISLMRNYGQHNALLCGIRSAQNDVIVTIDDDLQHPPEEIPKLIGELRQGFDVVYGVAQERRQTFLRRMAATCIRLALQGAMGSTARRVSAFRAFRTPVRDAFSRYESPFVSIDVLLSWGTRSYSWVQVEELPRKYGKSNYTVRKLLSHALDLLTGFSVLPLQAASWIGFGLTLFGVGMLAWVVGRYIAIGGSVPGFPFLASAIAIFSGAQLFALGIIGEYIGRIHRRTMERPVYMVRTRTSERRHV